ncbi:hypothetical protein FPZ42_11640 [Mucilaginibacter achroorhodeus]|uniref:Uncharacterized protein n=2 Tax=Mucilaginibacter achroorhodeus TaxID=2599294 RepID=A0A563U4J4_9SPHI|nr:hypothetical protein FPZ42_11640 [Mucilaginibacter achroorhodeus]
MDTPCNSIKRIGFTIVLFLMMFSISYSQSWKAIAAKPSTLMINGGIDIYKTDKFILSLVSASQTVAALSPAADSNFDFTPGERLKQRDKDSLYYLGDIKLRIRPAGQTAWQSYSTAYARKPVQKLATGVGIIAAADLSATLPPDMPVKVKRYWQVDKDNLVLRFTLTNTSSADVEIGSVGIPMIFNNILEGKTLEQAHATNVFSDPYIGADAGYIQVNHLHGRDASLLVIPQQNAPLEAYSPLSDDLTPKGITFEGFHEWMICSKAYADNEWKGVEQWNAPTSFTLAKGASRSIAIKFVLAPSIREIETELVRQHRPLAVGVPGYVLPMNETGKLFVKYLEKIKNISVYPEGAATVKPAGKTAKGYLKYDVSGKLWGRARVSVVYADNTLQTINYKIIKPQAQAVADLGAFLTTKQWYSDPKDPFKRSPAVMNYDYETGKILTQERRAWFAGLSDEAGAGSWLAAFMKQLLKPDEKEIEKLKQFANKTLWGKLQLSNGPKQYGVRKSLFYYQPDIFPAGTYDKNIVYKGWEAWPKKEADQITRSYNYPHVAAAHWVLYRLARYHHIAGIDWNTNLDRAYNTAIAMVKLAPDYAEFGQMEGSVFLFILKDLQREGKKEMAATLEAEMNKRALHWKTLKYPFGSEMPWDSTGQEEVYMWSSYFGMADKADVTLNAILAYAPAVPHWGYNGSARRYWDFVFGGKLARIERQLHHYGSALNSIPLLTAYRRSPQDFYLLRTGYAGTMGALANITKDGFGPAAFHSYPSTLKIDGYASDYGPGFYGYAVNSGTYIVKHPEFGWVAFGGNVTESKGWISTEVTCAGQNRVFFAPASLWLTTAAGNITHVDYQPKTGMLRIKLTGSTYLNIDDPNNAISGILPKQSKRKDGYYFIPEDKRNNAEVILKLKR